ncbi:MAG: T9SS type A sorting domain-containing protein [Bacteroidetes bacterium]|nr:T9SS type A sorting domain-containing protein [Bacteroidota bacterium]MBK7108995.1 T9SS type A sorting domain-containing protein [Bacteroidota bacterium]MBK8488682.1 T9SS type A sorting domain-containing protein [Bacteroidota bacterium]
MRSKFLFILLVLLHQQVFSQNRAINWAFGDSAGLNFTTEPPTPFLSSIVMYEPCASISDDTGNLLFYTNGKTIWNAAHEIMLNGNFLDIGVGTLSSCTQGVLIIPDPGDSNKYYVFHHDLNYLKYTIVDMSLEDGLGLVTSKNNIASELPFTEKLQAVRHANGRDWWLLIESLKEVDVSSDLINFYSFLISPSGISLPSIHEGTILPDQETIYIFIGQMKFNQQGTMLACTNGRSVNLYNFDRCSGYLSHLYTIDSIFIGNNSDAIYGLEFSQLGAKLYITKAGEAGKGYIFQYTIDSISDIKATQQIIYIQDETGTNEKYLDQLQIALDGKIYIAMVDVLITTTHLCVINEPELTGMACNFDTLTIDAGNEIILGLPNMPNYNLGVMEKSGCDTIGTTAINTINNNAIQLYPNPAHNYIYLKQAPQGLVQIHIADIYGKEVLYVNQQSTDVINISTLPSGLYFITITQENAMLITQKLVVER